MKQFLILFSAALVMVMACNKDNFQTKPTLKIKSISGNRVPVGSGLRVEFEFTDKEGDASDTLFVRKQRLNRRPATLVRETFALDIPGFPNSTKGEFQVNLEYQAHLVAASSGSEPDTLLLKFVAKDLKGNKSDTVATETIVVFR